MQLVADTSTDKQQLLKEMFAVAGVPFNNDALEKDGSNVPNPTKQRRFEDCDFLDDYDDESTKAARQANSDEQDACRSLCMIFGFDSMRSEQLILYNPFRSYMEWWKMHNSQFSAIAILARKYLAIPASSAPSEPS